jgi:signal transduction histidine kinase
MIGIWPAAMADVPAETQRARFATLQQTLITRSLPGTLFYPVPALLYLPLVVNDIAGLVVTLVAAVLLTALGLTRRAFYRSTARRAWDPHVWRVRFLLFASASIAILDLLVAIECWRRSLDPACIALVAASIALRASSTYAACADLMIHDAFSRWTRVSVFVSLALVGTTLSLVLFALLAMHMLYIHKQSRQLNHEFWAAIHEREERTRIETELRLAQKLESVGRLAAGIAHEINTPLQAMKGNLEFISEGVDELVTIARAYQRVAAGPVDAAHASELDYLSENLPCSLDAMHDSVARAATIVRSVSTFASRDDAQTRVPLDVNSALESTLAISRNEYAAIADVETQLSPLPLVDCIPSELNQALLHLVVNAAQAIADQKTDDRGVIRVMTSAEQGAVRIAISDTGPGIPHAIRDRIFDPFFTTKASSNSGQGLAIVRSVVTRHGGELTFDSEPGRTTFVIRLPLAA